MIKIKDFSEKTGFSVRMLRYLEQIGLLVPDRDSNSYRVYKEAQVEEALWIKKLQELGIQLKEVGQLNASQAHEQQQILETVLGREQEVAELKSETIPMLKNILDFMRREEQPLDAYFEKATTPGSKLFETTPRQTRVLSEVGKFKRTVCTIPILKSIYEDHLTIDANIELIATDVMKFDWWFKETTHTPQVFSVLNESSFAFGKEVNERFIEGYEKAWRKFLPQMGFTIMEEFSKEDVGQLMGPHDIVIHTTFRYKDTGVEGEIVIPYTPIYTMSQLSNKI